MATYGRALRQKRAMAEYDRRLCVCGHPPSEHREENYALGHEMVDGQLTEIPNPAYRPGVFRCWHDGCGCKAIDNGDGAGPLVAPSVSNDNHQQEGTAP